MKKSIQLFFYFTLISTLLSCSKETSSASCSDGILNGTETGVDCGGDCDTCYGIGLTGEAGGIIFYDKGAYTDGWRYLKAALEDLENHCMSSIQFDSDLNTDNNIGTGLENSQYIIDSGQSATIWLEANDITIGDQNDWFVPSKDELTLIYENKLIIPNLSTESSECNLYWGSTLEILPNGKFLPKVLDITTGEFVFTDPGQRVRCVRRF